MAKSTQGRTGTTDTDASVSPADISIAAPIIVWFRDDLRLSDNPALSEAVESGRTLLCVYVLDEESENIRPLGGAAKWWLANSLRALTQSLAKRGGSLVLRRGKSADIIPSLANQIGAAAVHWNRRYDAAGTAVDDAVATALAAHHVAVRTFQASLLHEPRSIRTSTGTPYSVFTPFWRQARSLDVPRQPLPAPARLTNAPQASNLVSEKLENWNLEPSSPDWAQGLRETWKPGEAGAQARADEFFASGLPGYAKLRDRPDLPHTSRLSPHLRFGEISPFQLWHTARLAMASPRDKRADAADLDKFLAEPQMR